MRIKLLNYQHANTSSYVMNSIETIPNNQYQNNLYFILITKLIVATWSY